MFSITLHPGVKNHTLNDGAIKRSHKVSPSSGSVNYKEVDGIDGHTVRTYQKYEVRVKSGGQFKSNNGFQQHIHFLKSALCEKNFIIMITNNSIRISKIRLTGQSNKTRRT